MLALAVATVVVVPVAVAFVLATSGALIGPDTPRSGPEAWIARDDARARAEGNP